MLPWLTDPASAGLELTALQHYRSYLDALKPHPADAGPVLAAVRAARAEAAADLEFCEKRLKDHQTTCTDVLEQSLKAEIAAKTQGLEQRLKADIAARAEGLDQGVRADVAAKAEGLAKGLKADIAAKAEGLESSLKAGTTAAFDGLEKRLLADSEAKTDALGRTLKAALSTEAEFLDKNMKTYCAGKVDSLEKVTAQGIEKVLKALEHETLPKTLSDILGKFQDAQADDAGMRLQLTQLERLMRDTQNSVSVLGGELQGPYKSVALVEAAIQERMREVVSVVTRVSNQLAALQPGRAGKGGWQWVKVWHDQPESSSSVRPCLTMGVDGSALGQSQYVDAQVILPPKRA
uniref:Uncharacterized protein n=1 Tax=Zooxanthella nutricula TaxID=1333877 RepID=A0A7S2QMQ1_9DINO